MRVPRVYVDTSVFGGSFDEEFARASERFFEVVRDGRFALVTSGLVEKEMTLAPSHARELFEELAEGAEIVQVADETLALRDAYVSFGIISEQSLADALHVALATAADCDLIVSWNFKHIVNFRKIQQYNAVNALQGYGNIAIYSPLEVVDDEDQDV